jgi:ABC-type transporter Mla MlaB component
MLHIKNQSDMAELVLLKVDGILNASSLPTLKALIEKKHSQKKKIRLDLGGVIHSDRSGIVFLRQWQDRIEMLGMSEFLKLELQTGPRPIGPDEPIENGSTFCRTPKQRRANGE